jgi:uncharacterized OB-fold protein
VKIIGRPWIDDGKKLSTEYFSKIEESVKDSTETKSNKQYEPTDEKAKQVDRCKRCNYLLYPKEKFCRNCGEPSIHLNL